MGGKPLGYKIKHVHNQGYKGKKPMYEIKPGVWVQRHQVPENKGRSWHSNNKWNNSEKGFIINLFSSAFKECRTGRHGKGTPIIFEFTKKSWWDHWLTQKKKYGMYCPYSKVLMTTIRGRGRGTTGTKRVATNISRDQIWPGRGYTPMNTIFCSVKFNLNKSCITPDGCQAVIDVYEQRMSDWLNDIVLQRELKKIKTSDPAFKKQWRILFKKFRKNTPKHIMQRFLDLAYYQAIANRDNKPIEEFLRKETDIYDHEKEKEIQLGRIKN